MTVLKTIIFTILVLKANTSLSQDISKHKWENRVLLVVTNSDSNKMFQNQIKELQSDKNGLNERKLVIYQIRKDRFKIGLENNQWQKSSKLYNQFKEGNSDFEVLLIGLDGGIKLRQNKLLTTKALFAIIDVMPMRRNEMNKK